MSTNENNQENVSFDDAWDDIDDLNINELGRILDDPLPKASYQTLRQNEQHFGFDNNFGSTWIYPENMPLRNYQLSITKAALFKNTLVVLPTGLGKTFIAAVVMYNIFRWYPTGKVIFMAPTRPLVAQQIEACKKIMPFPPEDVTELTGKMQRDKRMECWREKRVFFVTPQALRADMISQNEAIPDFPFQQVKLIVVDEAHRAKGRYAYVEVARALHQHNKYFRVLALSATPGRSMDDVAEVIQNLFISHLEVRWDTSIDIVQYVHHRNIKTIVVQYGEAIQRIREQMIKIIDPYMRQLIEADVISGSHQHITRNFLVMEQRRFRERQQSHPQKSAVASNFSICVSLFHALELLERHGLRVFLNSFEDDDEGRPKFVLTLNPSLRNLVEQLRDELGPNPFDVSAHTMTNGRIAEIPKNLDFGHPKFEEARKCILAHFEQNPDSRAIVFCEYRESVMMIYRLLLQHFPLLKPKCFVGHGGTTGILRALSQKQQIQIMSDFRAGKSNILIATSIGEEGIDVGEVDLIVCFDMNTSNPIRFVQRIGRTGRQRAGRVIMLVTEGKEQKILQDVLANKDQTNKKLLHSKIVQAALYKHSPRMVPTEFSPECLQIVVEPPAPVDKTTEEEKKKKNTSKTKAVVNNRKKLSSKEKGEENTQDLRNFFKKHDIKFDGIDSDDFEPAPVQITQRSKERIHRLFKNIQPCQSTNTQLMTETLQSCERLSSTLAVSSTKQAPQVKLDTQYLKKVNRLLKSSTDASVQIDNNLLKHLSSAHCSEAAKLFLLKRSYQKVREICEQIDILEALAFEDESNMSSHELEIRQTYESILNLFKNRDALQRFLEDAELDEMAAKTRQMKRAADSNDWDMTQEDYQSAKRQIFKGLDLQGPSWDTFHSRFESIKTTIAYQQLMTEKTKNNQNQHNIVADSIVFDALPAESTNMNSYDLEETAYNLAVGDSKYCSQWERDFQPNRVRKKSTPISNTILNAFERQKRKQTSARKLLETVKEPRYESDDEDIQFLPLDDEISIKICDKESKSKGTLTEDLLRPPKVIEMSFMQRQQSTPVQQLKKNVEPFSQHKLDLELEQAFDEESFKESNIEPSLQHELDLDYEQVFKEDFSKQTISEASSRRELDLDLQKAFEEPFPEEIEMLPKTLSGSSFKENTTPKNQNCEVAQTAAPSTGLFAMLESKPVNSNLTPHRSLRAATCKTNKIANVTLAQSTPKTPSKLAQQTFDASTNLMPSQNIESAVYPESPKNRPKTVTKLNEKSPCIITKYLNGMQRWEARRKMLSNKSCNESLIKKETADNSDIDSPVIRKRKRNFKRLTAGSDTEMKEKAKINQVPSSSNSDDDFEEKDNFPKKRRCLSKQSPKPFRRARLCDYFNDEAEKSVDYNHSDEGERHEETLAHFACDSVTVDSGDADEDNAITSTQIQAIHHQSVKSPNQYQRGDLKIPANRNYDASASSVPQSFCSPQNIESTVYPESTKSNEKSPCIMTKYFRGMQRWEARREKKSCNESLAKKAAAADSDIDSPVIRKRKRNVQNLERQSAESDNEMKSIKQVSSSSNSDDDFEEKNNFPKKQRCLSKQNPKPLRRARLCDFFDDEAEKSGGSGHTDEGGEHEDTLGNFVCDSVIINSDDADEDNAIPASQMQAIYLQSVKSPNQCQGRGFKIPANRNYDINVYSQPIEPSDYCIDSFVVHDDKEEISNCAENTTLCPLEKAERILEKRRREAKRRRGAELETKQ